MSKFEFIYIRTDDVMDITFLNAEDEDHAVLKFFEHYSGAMLMEVCDRGEVF